MSMIHPAFVLHRVAYRDTSWMLHLFTPDSGRLVVLAKGARQKKRRFSVSFEPLTPMLVTWVGRSSLKTLSQAEPSGAAFRMGLSQQYCAFYLNELLLRLLPEHQDSPTLFAAYLAALSQLSRVKDKRETEWALRSFERDLLVQLGFAIDCEKDARGEPIRPQTLYYYQTQLGWVKEVKSAFTSDDLRRGGSFAKSVEGDVILQWHNNQKNESVRRLSKQVLCGQIQRLLGSRPLKSRVQWQQLQAQLNYTQSV